MILEKRNNPLSFLLNQKPENIYLAYYEICFGLWIGTGVNEQTPSPQFRAKIYEIQKMI